MKRFITTIICFICIPVLIAIGIYIWTDPFRCLYSFDIENTDATNREYLSTELYLHNRDSIHYDSFIFASSRGGGFNTYQWKQYLDANSQPFLFQAWGETLMGEYLKLKYLDESGVSIKNAIIMFDIPGSFGKRQLSHKALDMKHYMFTGGSRLTYNVYQFFNFVQKPSSWIKSIKTRNARTPYCADRISNDWDNNNSKNFMQLPKQDSLKSCSSTTRNTFFEQIKGKSLEDVKVSAHVIDASKEKILKEMKCILDKHHTNYVVVLSPGICYTSPSVNPVDLEILQQIFGTDKVYNYAGINEYTTDPNNFSDPGHFGLRVGYQIMKDIYER